MFLTHRDVADVPPQATVLASVLAPRQFPYLVLRADRCGVCRAAGVAYAVHQRVVTGGTAIAHGPGCPVAHLYEGVPDRFLARPGDEAFTTEGDRPPPVVARSFVVRGEA